MSYNLRHDDKIGLCAGGEKKRRVFADRAERPRGRGFPTDRPGLRWPSERTATVELRRLNRTHEDPMTDESLGYETNPGSADGACVD
jgi:hypothetical protein